MHGAVNVTPVKHTPIVTKISFWAYGLYLVDGYQSSGGAYCLWFRGIILKLQVRFLKLHGVNIHEIATRIPEAPYQSRGYG
jgi:hypothetical protein